MFTFSVVSLLLIATTISVISFLMPFYIQDVLGFSPSSMGLMFLAAPVFTIALAVVSGRLTDRIGPRAPASIGVLATMSAFAIGLFLRMDSHWILPTLMMALIGVGSGFFNTPNQAAIIGSVPREYRGFATGMVQTIFGISALLGISLGGVLLTLAFRYFAGLADATPSAAHPQAFVASMNVAYLACLALLVIALFSSFLRGGTKIEAAVAADLIPYNAHAVARLGPAREVGDEIRRRGRWTRDSGRFGRVRGRMGWRTRAGARRGAARRRHERELVRVAQLGQEGARGLPPAERGRDDRAPGTLPRARG